MGELCVTAAPVGAEPKRGRGRPRRRSVASIQGAIVATARELFLKDGYGATSMDALAKAARISKRTVYEHFASKAEIFAAIVDEHRQTMLALPQPMDDRPLEQVLAAIFCADLAPDEEERRIGVIRLAVQEAQRFPELDALLRERGRDRARSELAAWLAREAARGRLRPLDDPAAYARILADMVFTGMPRDRPPRGEERLRHLDRCIQLFLNGLRPAANAAGS